jgi:hypothetical protein
MLLMERGRGYSYHDIFAAVARFNYCMHAGGVDEGLQHSVAQDLSCTLVLCSSMVGWLGK